MRKVALNMLTPDMRLGRSVVIGSNTLINAGVKDLTRYTKRLERLGIFWLYIEDSVSEGIEFDDLISERTRMRCKKNLDGLYTQLKSNYTIDMGQVTDLVENLLDDIYYRPDLLISINEIGGMGDNTLDHSLNTTIYAICLAVQLKYNTYKTKELALGTLLHDVGKTVLDRNILFKPARLSPDEFAHIKQHPQLGYELLSKNKSVPETSRQICLQHHERLDGTGYPNGIQDKELSEIVRISGIVDVYEALTVDRCYHKAVSPQHAMEILSKEAESKLDIQLISVFTQNIAIYPNGTTVLLSDGRYGVVKEQNRSFPLRPIVRLLAKEGDRYVATEEINLIVTLNVTIVDSDVNLP